MKQFIFMYPIPEIIDYEVKKGAYGSRETEKEFLERMDAADSDEEREEIRKEAVAHIRAEYRKLYGNTLNECINTRYRENGYAISYAVFDGSPISDVIDLRDSDKTIEVGLNFKTHTTKQADGKFPYPDNDYILDQIDADTLRIAGFHAWDCVDKLAKRSYECGLDTLVDEDLTELFTGRLIDPDFRIDRYPTYNPRRYGEDMYEMFMEARIKRPWLWQEY